MAWTSLYIPMARGLDLSKEAQLGGDELHTALNVDFGPDGSIKGRPSRAAFSSVYWRDSTQDPDNGTSYSTAANFTTGSAAAFTPKAMVRIRDAAGERPAFISDQRIFTHDGTSWNDNGAFACLKVDRVADFAGSTVLTTPTAGRGPVAPDFAYLRDTTSGASESVWALMTSAGVYQREEDIAGTAGIVGMGSQVGTTTAVVGRCNFPTANALKFIYRTAGGGLNIVTLATDAAAPADTGDAPCICPGIDGTSFLVSYRTTTANVFKVLKVGLTGTVLWTYTSGAIAGLHGLWVSGGGTGKISIGITCANGFIHRQLDSAGAVTGADATAAVGVQAYDVVVGVTTSNLVNVAWWAFRSGADEDIWLGYVNMATDALTVMETFYGAHAFTDATLRWGICHQPVSFDGHTYLTLATAGAAAYTATWVTLDLGNWFTDATIATGPDQRPTLAACGPVQGTYPMKQPVQATALTGATGFAFSTVDWQSFALVPGNDQAPATLTGLTAMNGLNKVTISKPQVAVMGDTSVLSGSVQRMFARGECWELGYPFLGGEPAFAAEAVAGGSIAAGDYSVTACWRWTDEAGQVHRSAPAPARTVTITAGVAQTLRCHVVIPWLTEKTQRAALEVYCNSLAATSTYTLQTTTDVNFNITETAQVVNLTTDPLTSTLGLYTNGGAFANYHVPGDGGVAAVGRRLWTAGSDQVFASKLWLRGNGPEFSDEASASETSLAVNIPAGAGRVIALEALDDKLVVFCARGVYLIQDGGPDNTGVGSDFAPAFRVSDLAIAGPRSSCLTDQGVLFCTTLDTVDAARGGPWLVDRQFTFTQRQYLGRLAQTFFLRTNSWVPEVAYSPERQQAYITVDGADGTTDGVAVADLRHEKWAVWSAGTTRSITVVGGVLWLMGDDAAAYSGAPGSDAVAGDYAMVVRTAAFSADGRDGLGWSRVRSVSAHSADGAASHTLTMTAYLDQVRTALSSGAITQTTGTEATWPSSRLDPEWRLPIQKCSTISVQLSATPAVARWAAIRLDVAPLPRRAPAKSRT